ncbi:MAG: type II toxin-antitoxin system Phd/YefM family antitoxin [Planctomycetes bacterium]|nr:type II toxin-antitoxin system Phd/YefM family antitoxin [Planctomycetota bacterium]
MRSVGIRNLKDRLSEYVRLASAGETVLVTERDRVVAELCPPRHGRAGDVHDALLAEAVRQGWVSLPALRAGVLPPRIPVAPLDEILEDLARDRDGR